MDYIKNRSVPFEITAVGYGFQVLKGLFKVKSQSVELEYEVQDSFVGAIKSEVKTVQIPFSEIEKIRFKKGWFSSRVILEVTSLKLLEDMPGTEQATAVLKIKRKHSKDAESLISKVRVQLSEYHLDQLE